jgi:hypothetical protein
MLSRNSSTISFGTGRAQGAPTNRMENQPHVQAEGIPLDAYAPGNRETNSPQGIATRTWNWRGFNRGGQTPTRSVNANNRQGARNIPRSGRWGWKKKAALYGAGFITTAVPLLAGGGWGGYKQGQKSMHAAIKGCETTVLNKTGEIEALKDQNQALQDHISGLIQPIPDQVQMSLISKFSPMHLTTTPYPYSGNDTKTFLQNGYPIGFWNQSDKQAYISLGGEPEPFADYRDPNFNPQIDKNGTVYESNSLPKEQSICRVVVPSGEKNEVIANLLGKAPNYNPFNSTQAQNAQALLQTVSSANNCKPGASLTSKREQIAKRKKQMLKKKNKQKSPKGI